MNPKKWLRLFRAQTAPATLLIVLVPYLAAAAFLSWNTLALGIYAVLLHFCTFGHNSLMDYAMGYDKRDPSKSHHPLLTEDWDDFISLHEAQNVIQWGLALLVCIGSMGSVMWGANPLLCMVCLLLYVVFGHAYNDGLSKESIHGWLPISLCFTSLAGLGWFLSHQTIGWVGWVFLAYIFLTELFEIGYEGNLKELPVAGKVEEENLLHRMGARIYIETRVVGQHGIYGPEYVTKFTPGSAPIFSWFTKMGAWTLAATLAVSRVDLSLWWLAMGVPLTSLLVVLNEERVFERAKELRTMSIMEVISIYLPIPCLVSWPVAGVLMLVGVLYFFGVNKLIWGTDYPRV